MSLRDRLANAFASVYLSVMVLYVLRSKYRAWRQNQYWRGYADGRGKAYTEFQELIAAQSSYHIIK